MTGSQAFMAVLLIVFCVIPVVLGTAFFAIGTLGLLRLPDFFTRIHATGKCDTLGAILVLGGVAAFLVITGGKPNALTALKLVSIVAFVLLANPTATHAFARSALRSGLHPWGQRADTDPPRGIPDSQSWTPEGGA
jgi:multicomponent Na+:H+ antiporter subunit G